MNAITQPAGATEGNAKSATRAVREAWVTRNLNLYGLRKEDFED